MKCPVCGNIKYFDKARQYNKADRYEEYMGIKNVERTWWKCLSCGHHHATCNYDIAELEKMYENGYRSSDFRGESIEQAYNRITLIPNNENVQRCEWFIENSKGKKVLDFGSGLGVFPDYLSKEGFIVDCIEANKKSQKFIKNKLKLPCYDKIPKNSKYDVITLVHVLEHFKNPKNFLMECKESLSKEGQIFIEIPDGSYFNSIPEDHDDFNSMHLQSFTPNSLTIMLNKCGYQLGVMRLMSYKERVLHRIMAVANAVD